MSEKTPLFGAPYNSRFNTDIDLLVYENTFQYSNMVFHGFYGGTSLQSQELNELQETLLNQLSKSNEFFGNWMQHGATTSDPLEITTKLEQTTLPVDPTLSQDTTIIDKGWYRYTNNNLHQFIQVPGITYKDSTLPLVKLNNLLSKRNVFGRLEDWEEILTDKNSDALDIYGAHRQQVYVNLDSILISDSFNSYLPIFRVPSLDIYGFAIEKSHYLTSIDSAYPKYPYTASTGNWRKVGDIAEFQDILLNKYPRSGGEASLAFSAGSLGLLVDNSYITGLEGATLPELKITMIDESDLIKTGNFNVGDDIFQCGMNSALNATGVAKSCVGFVRDIDPNNKYITIGFNDISKAYDFVKNVKLAPESDKVPILLKDSTTFYSFNTGATFIDTTGININQRWYMNKIGADTLSVRTAQDSHMTSLYDIGDNARKSGQEYQTIVPSTIHKYQWFDFDKNEVMGSNKFSVASGFLGVTIISKIRDMYSTVGGYFENKINTPRGGYTNGDVPTSSLWEILIRRPSVDELRDLNPGLIDNDGENGPRAKIRELWSNRIHENVEIISEDIKFVSIDTAYNQAVITLDDKGSVRILWTPDFNAVGNRGMIDYIYFDKEWIEQDGFLTDENGTVTGLNNKDFVQVCLSGGFSVHPLMAWLLHKSGKLYGVELTSSRKNINGQELKKLPSHSDFGTPETEITSLLYIYNPFDITTPTNGILQGLFPTTIKHWLNSIPKVDGNRLPIIYVSGGHGPWPGHAICAFPPTSGEFIPPRDVFNHPVQTVQLIIFGTSSDMKTPEQINTLITNHDILLVSIALYQRGAFNKLQKISSIYNTQSNTWTYEPNTNFDSALYNLLMGVKVTVNDEDHIVPVPPRSFYCNTNLISGACGILSNNGIYATIACYGSSNIPIGQGTDFSGCGATLPNIPSPQSTFDSGKINLQGDFALPSGIFSRPKITPPTAAGININMCQKYVDNKKVLISTPLDNINPYILNHIGFNVNASHILCDIDNLVYSSRNTNTADSEMENLYGESSVPYIDPAKIIKKVITGAANSGIIFEDNTCMLWGKNSQRQIIFDAPPESFNNNIRDIVFVGSGISDNNLHEDNFTILIRNNDTSMLLGENFDSKLYGSNVSNFLGFDRTNLQQLTGVKQITYIKTEGYAAQILVTISEDNDTWKVIPYGPDRTTTDTTTYPVDLIRGLNQKIIQAEQSEEEGYVLTEDGRIMLWPLATVGSADEVRQDNITSLNDVKKIAVTRDGLLVLKEDGSVNYFGKLSTNTGRHLSQSCESINTDDIFINDIYTGYWHGAIFIAGDNELLFSYNTSFPIDVNDTLPLPFILGKWDGANDNIKILTTNTLLKYKTYTSSTSSGLTKGYNTNYTFTTDGTHIDYDPENHFQSATSTAFNQQGFGLPPGKMETITELEARGIFYPDKYNYNNFFGNTFESEFYPELDIRLRAPPSQQFLKNYINNSHIVSIIAYKDHNDKLPFKIIDDQAVWDESYHNSLGYDISLLSIGNSNHMDNPLVWITGYANGTAGVKQDGSIMIWGKRTADGDHFLTDPFHTGIYPDRPLQNNGNWIDIRPVSYTNALNDLKEIGDFSI